MCALKWLLGALLAAAVAACDAQAPQPHGLLVPVQGVQRSELRDTFDQDRGGVRHEAIDIMAPRGTPVVAVADGRVAKLFTGVPGGLTVYQLDLQSRYAYYYAHLDRYADKLREGMLLKAGDPIGFVGSSGNASAEAPHLHFAVFELGPEKQWWKGKPINPYPLLGETPR
jgi:murein DD-endopeptidase MepM/ murein hydrolase activator NlpD